MEDFIECYLIGRGSHIYAVFKTFVYCSCNLHILLCDMMLLLLTVPMYTMLSATK